MEKLDLTTPNFTDENIQKLSELFPNCVTEDSNGKTIDFDALKQELSGNIVEGNKECYQLTWPGKAESLVTANTPINKTLRPNRKESKDFDNTENLYIEGDNLEVLKLLQETYLGKIKMIYIDPPYNTGKDFVYKDNFTQDKAEYDEESGNVDDEGGRLVSNPDSNGRYHSDWLSMMYPRLKLARNLLTDDGVIFISIDSNEAKNMQSICEEIFGVSNFIGLFPAILNLKGNQDAYGFAETHEYVVVCTRRKDQCVLNKFNIEEEELMREWLSDEYGLYKEADNLRATGVNAPRERRPNLWYPIFLNKDSGDFYITDNNSPILNTDICILPVNPAGEELSWYWGRSTFNSNKHNLILKLTANGHQFYKKQRPQLGDLPTKKPKSIFYKSDYSTSTATTRLKNLFSGKKIFDGPKPVPLIYDLLTIGLNEGDTVLDFFAGSSTTAHAVMQINADKNKNYKFIMAQFPEDLGGSKEREVKNRVAIDFCDDNDFSRNVSEIGKERIRRAGEKIKEDNVDKEGINDLDVGFRVLKVGSSNMKDTYYNPDNTQQSNLLDLASNIKDSRTEEDLLFQVLLDWGVDLTLKIERKDIAGKSVYFVDDDTLAACFEENINEDFVKELAKTQPLRVVFKDSGFASDDVKINIRQIFKHTSVHTDIKVI
jgi:adenine-specific DNA-methyltransferase